MTSARPARSEPEGPISTRLLQQRIRNRIIEYLETAASADEQRAYERNVPIAQVPNEMINQWEDWVRGDDWDWFDAPVFSPDEQRAMRKFHAEWLMVIEATPKPIPYTVENLIGTPAWDRFMKAASEALQAFQARGRFEEETERET